MSKVHQAAKRAEAADRMATHKAAAQRNHPAMQTIGMASEIADQPPLRAIGAVMVATGALTRRPMLAAAGLRLLTSHYLANRIRGVLKHSFDRTRPARAIEQGYRFTKGDSPQSELRSFPSGHTAGAIAVARALGRDYPSAAVPAAITAIAVAVAQVPRGKHYVSDVAAGAVIGFTAEWLVNRALRVVGNAFDGAPHGRGTAAPPRA
jgi:membrane-associated phospholipid phosphatase